MRSEEWYIHVQANVNTGRVKDMRYELTPGLLSRLNLNFHQNYKLKWSCLKPHILFVYRSQTAYKTLSILMYAHSCVNCELERQRHNKQVNCTKEKKKMDSNQRHSAV